MTPEIYDIFLITGQSNAEGARDSAQDEDTLRENAVAPAPGVAFCMDVGYKGNMGEPYDLSRGRSGFSPALAKRWNELTGRGVYVIQTAVSGSPIERWAYGECRRADTGKNFLDNTIEAAKKVLRMGWGENKSYNFGDIYYFWCQGETSQAHEWTGDGWKMPGVHLIDTDTYYQKFMSYHYGLLSNVNVKAGCIMLVRTLARVSTRKSLELGLLTDNNASKQAQYTAHSECGAKLRIMSRVGEFARMENTPGLGAGYVWSDNCHYRKKGYNHHGRELAENLYRWMNPEIDKTPTGLEWFEPDCRTRMRNGTVLKVDALRGAMTSACVLPLWADNTHLSFSVTENPGGYCSVDKYGTIRFAAGAPLGTRAGVRVTADAGYTIEITAECAEPAPFVETGKGVVTDFIWDFTKGDLTEYNQYNNLTLEEPAEPEFRPEGVLPHCGFNPEKKLFVSDSYSWSFAWTGNIPHEWKLAEGGASRVDTCVDRDGKKYVCYVSSEGNVFELAYPKDGDAENLKLAYDRDTREMTLYADGRAVSSVKAEKPFSSAFDMLLRSSRGAVMAEIRVTMFVEE